MNLTPANAGERTRNPLRPQTFDEIIGQTNAKYLMKRAVEVAKAEDRVLDHVLLVGPSGTGKSTFSHVIANEMGYSCFDVEAPVSFDTLLQLRSVMLPGDVLRIEEIHQQAIMERRGRGAAAGPEQLYSLMEDRVIVTEHGPLDYPPITVIGTTTDEGMLPDAFVNRFPLRPRLEPYSRDELVEIAAANAATLGVSLQPIAAFGIADAARGVPREINNLVKNCRIMSTHGIIDPRTVAETLAINKIEPDGLTPDMSALLRFLYLRGKRITAKGEVRYEASVNAIATAIGKSRDSKAVALRVEPYLIERGLLTVAHSGRSLTDAGIGRARELASGAGRAAISERRRAPISMSVIDKIAEVST